jgi:predicted 3-demethylubiquinone-9 3-methyltransferase (glyoxalase superfamily)
MNTITPCLWFDNESEDVAEFYLSIFPNSGIEKLTYYNEEGFEIHGKPAGSVLTVEFKLYGQPFVALNGGDNFKHTPAISFYVTCKTEQEIDTLWQGLSEGGSALMNLDNYPFSKKYGWIQDKYGVSWQLILPFDIPQQGKETHKIAPCLMFCGTQQGNAEKAMNFYVSVFNDSRIIMIEHYGPDYFGPEGQVVHAEFLLNQQKFVAMDSGVEQPFTFNEAISFMVYCENQKVIDHYWETLTEDGDEKAQACGWLKDKYGVSWQVVPTMLNDYLNDTDPVKSRSVMKALLHMKKLDIRKLQQAYEL